MKAIMVMYDSLNRHYLPPYGCQTVIAPNFHRLAELAVTFDNCYAGSLPCMPARRELHTGRYNFLHRSWGPLEPFDDSMPEILREHGVYAHLVSDHYHYWEDGGATYHPRFSSWEVSRGQEGDPWKGSVADPPIPEKAVGRQGPLWRRDWVNRQYLRRPEDHPQNRTFDRGLEFMRKNQREDNWYLQIETFDPHEPFFVPQRFKDLYPHHYEGPFFDWPPYSRVSRDRGQVEHIKLQYAALVSLCDENLGRVLSAMDELDLWSDTLLIVNTDHGFLLGEHGWWGKCRTPFYSEIARLPLFVWDPRSCARKVRCDSLVQSIDLAPTVLQFFGILPPAAMTGRPLREALGPAEPFREACLFGMHGGHVNCTDGRFVYMRAPRSQENTPLYEYTLMPVHMRSFFTEQELHGVELAGPFGFTRGCRVLKTTAPRGYWDDSFQAGNLLFDLATDPGQENPLEDREQEQRMIDILARLMAQNEAPAEQFERLGLG